MEGTKNNNNNPNIDDVDCCPSKVEVKSSDIPLITNLGDKHQLCGDSSRIIKQEAKEETVQDENSGGVSLVENASDDSGGLSMHVLDEENANGEKSTCSIENELVNSLSNEAETRSLNPSVNDDASASSKTGILDKVNANEGSSVCSSETDLVNSLLNEDEKKFSHVLNRTTIDDEGASKTRIILEEREENENSDKSASSGEIEFVNSFSSEDETRSPNQPVNDDTDLQNNVECNNVEKLGLDLLGLKLDQHENPAVETSVNGSVILASGSQADAVYVNSDVTLHDATSDECVEIAAFTVSRNSSEDNGDNCTTASDTASSLGMDTSDSQRTSELSNGSQANDDVDHATTAEMYFETEALEALTPLPNGLSEDILKLHPIHQKLQSEMISLQRKCKQQAEQVSRLQAENSKLMMESDEKSESGHTHSDIYEVQMEALEKTILQLQRELEAHKSKLVTHDETAKKTIAHLHRDLGGRLDQMTQRYEAANKDKETMVIKYAQSHKEVLNLKKVLEEMEKKAKESTKEKELYQNKFKNLGAERNRICQCLSAKTSELECAVRENEKLKEQLSSKDIKIKWAQNKLRMEMDSHKETEQKLEKLQQKLFQTREEAEQIRRDCQEMIRTYQESEDIKSNSLDMQLKKKESELKLQQQEKTDQEEVYILLRTELDAIKRNHKLSIEENNNLTRKVQILERERLEYETNLSRMKELNNSHKQEVVDLSAKLSEMDNLQAQMERQKEITAVNQQEIERLRDSNTELQNDMDACRIKEGELLEFTERLTSKNVALQSEYAALEAKDQMLHMEQNRINKLNHSLEEENSNLQTKLEEEKQLRQQETQLLARKLAEKTRTAETLSLKLEEEMNENKVMKRRHLASIRELTREIQQLKRRLESFENTSGLNAGSRTSSSGSLDNCAINNSLAGINNPSLNSQSSGVKTQRVLLAPSSGDHEPGAVIEPTQLVIERIVKLQKILARKNEKIEFLEEHMNTLDKELRKKSRIIQSYVMKLEPGALATMKMDRNKMEVAKKGGIMASVYSSHAIDAAMTLDLSLEINRKLQAVLEDTLLKNITLKENINTLGEEIARLTNAENKQ